jgi:hypothetical protein
MNRRMRVMRSELLENTQCLEPQTVPEATETVQDSMQHDVMLTTIEENFESESGTTGETIDELVSTEKTETEVVTEEVQVEKPKRTKK